MTLGQRVFKVGLGYGRGAHGPFGPPVCSGDFRAARALLEIPADQPDTADLRHWASQFAALRLANNGQPPEGYERYYKTSS